MNIDKQQKPVLFEILYLIIPAFLLFFLRARLSCPHVVRYDTRTGCACSHACSLSECFRVYACACACSCVYTCASVCLSFSLFKRKGVGCLFISFFLPGSLCICLWLSLSLSLQPCASDTIQHLSLPRVLRLHLLSVDCQRY